MGFFSWARVLDAGSSAPIVGTPLNHNGEWLLSLIQSEV